MSHEASSHGPQAAAEAFYRQSEDAFAEQIKLMGATDPRLIKAFEMTRRRYLEQDGSQTT